MPTARQQHVPSLRTAREQHLSNLRTAREQHPLSVQTARQHPQDNDQTVTEPLTFPNHPLGRITIRKANPRDLTYIDALQRQHVNNTGFVPKTAIIDHLERGSYTLLTVNEDPAGYLMANGGVRKPYRLIQVNIQPDAWRTGLGTILIQRALAEARTKRITTVTATVRDGLPMNPTVQSTGAQITGFDTRPKARRRKLIHYAWYQPPPHQLLLPAVLDFDE